MAVLFIILGVLAALSSDSGKLLLLAGLFTTSLMLFIGAEIIMYFLL